MYHIYIYLGFFRYMFSLKMNPKHGHVRAAFFGFKADLKARHTMHCLKRWYKCNQFLCSFGSFHPLKVLTLNGNGY